MESMTIEQLAQMYGARLFLHDYGAHFAPNRGREGLLFCSGAGLAMSIMDAAQLRYCIDVDAMCASFAAKKRTGFEHCLVELATCATWSQGTIAFAGWYSISDIEPMRKAHVAATRWSNSIRQCPWYEGGAAHQSLQQFLLECSQSSLIY